MELASEDDRGPELWRRRAAGGRPGRQELRPGDTVASITLFSRVGGPPPVTDLPERVRHGDRARNQPRMGGPGGGRASRSSSGTRPPPRSGTSGSLMHASLPLTDIRSWREPRGWVRLKAGGRTRDRGLRGRPATTPGSPMPGTCWRGITTSRFHSSEKDRAALRGLASRRDGVGRPEVAGSNS